MKFLKVFGANILAIILLLVIIFTVVSISLDNHTRHGESLTVPDIKGIPVNDAITVLEQKKLRWQIIDSLFFDDKPKLSVLELNPPPQAKVKEGRIIYLTINSKVAPQVSVPDLIDVSLRQAQAMLLGAGLKAGELIYKPDIAQNVVLEQQYQGKKIDAGSKLPKGSVVDLVLGSGLDGEDVSLPDLNGLTLEEANNLLQNSSLNVGAVVYQGAINDSASAKVFRQHPVFTEDATVKQGQAIDMFLKQ